MKKVFLFLLFSVGGFAFSHAMESAQVAELAINAFVAWPSEVKYKLDALNSFANGLVVQDRVMNLMKEFLAKYSALLDYKQASPFWDNQLEWLQHRLAIRGQYPELIGQLGEIIATPPSDRGQALMMSLLADADEGKRNVGEFMLCNVEWHNFRTAFTNVRSELLNSIREMGTIEDRIGHFMYIKNLARYPILLLALNNSLRSLLSCEETCYRNLHVVQSLGSVIDRPGNIRAQRELLSVFTEMFDSYQQEKEVSGRVYVFIRNKIREIIAAQNPEAQEALRDFNKEKSVSGMENDDFVCAFGNDLPDSLSN